MGIKAELFSSLETSEGGCKLVHASFIVHALTSIPYSFRGGSYCKLFLFRTLWCLCLDGEINGLDLLTLLIVLC